MDEAAIVAALRANPDLLARLAQVVAAPAPRQSQGTYKKLRFRYAQAHAWHRQNAALEAQLLGVPPTLRALERTGSMAAACTGTLTLHLEAQVMHPDGPCVTTPKVLYEPAWLLYQRKAAINPRHLPVRHLPRCHGKFQAHTFCSPSPRPSRSPPPRCPAPVRELSPGDGPWPYSRDGSPQPPLPSSSDNTNDNDNAAGMIDEGEPVVDEHPYNHPYYDTPTSYEERTTNNGRRACGGRARGQDGSVQQTFIELLGDRKSKYDYTAAHTHPFATLHGLSHFNPYSAIKAERECYGRVSKPKGLAGGPGRGGETKLHEELGLRMDVQFYNQGFRGAVKQALHKFVPKNLEPGAKITWNRYSAAARRQVYKYCYDLIPAFQHFRDQTGEDCWAVALIAQQYLQVPPHANLRPNLKEYEDDYTTNAPAYRTGPNAPNPRTAPTHASRPRPPPANPPHDRSAGPPRGQATIRAPTPAVAGPSRARPASNVPHTQDNPQTTSNSSSSRDDGLPPASTERQNRKADKQTAAEQARAKAKAQVQAQAAKRQNQPSTSSRAKGKQPVHPPHQDESEDDEEATRQFAKKVKASPRTHARIMSPDSETEPAPTAGSKKGKASQAAKALAKAATKATTKTPAKCKADEDSAAEDEETQAPKAPNKWGKTSKTTQAAKRKAEEELVVEGEEPRKEIEEPQSKKRKIQPRMRLPPPSEPESPSTSLPADTPASQPAEDAIQISSSDPPEPGSSHAPIAVNSSDPPSGMVGTVSDSGHRIVGVSTMKVPHTKKAPLPPSDRVFRERKK
ncbi:hypothetical protein FRC10_009406 [Ceratobasidium sp. 414]|nr:hypothetical protein FRC10_009406 [Ceratobasidium sp. 414]